VENFRKIINWGEGIGHNKLGWVEIRAIWENISESFKIIFQISSFEISEIDHPTITVGRVNPNIECTFQELTLWSKDAATYIDSRR